MLPRKLASISERLASILSNTEHDVRSQSRENLRPGSQLDYDEESLDREDCEEENSSVVETSKSEKLDEKQKETFVESFPILNTPKALPPIQPKPAPSPPPGYSSSDPPSYGDIHPFAPTNLQDISKPKPMIIIVPTDNSVIVHQQVIMILLQ